MQNNFFMVVCNSLFYNGLQNENFFFVGAYTYEIIHIRKKVQADLIFFEISLVTPLYLRFKAI
jgi:hypothetical protein